LNSTHWYYFFTLHSRPKAPKTPKAFKTSGVESTGVSGQKAGPANTQAAGPSYVFLAMMVALVVLFVGMYIIRGGKPTGTDINNGAGTVNAVFAVVSKLQLLRLR
jgi:hypothetical protein